MESSVVKTQNVSKTYLIGKKIKVPAIKNVSLDIKNEDFVALVGSSGSGKSTLLNLIGCLDKPDHGSIYLNGEETSQKSHTELSLFRNRNIGFIFQSFNLLPILNVYENIEFPFLINGSRFSKPERKEIIDELIERVGLTEYKRHKSNELSGGQMQRVAIARALALSPSIVLADEPTANLDSKTSENILDLMLSLNDTKGITFIFATHDPIVMSYAKTTVRLKDGEVVF